MQRIKGKSRKTSDEITGYLIEIAGDREDAEQAANECGVRIRIIHRLDPSFFSLLPTT